MEGTAKDFDAYPSKFIVAPSFAQKKPNWSILKRRRSAASLYGVAALVACCVLLFSLPYWTKQMMTRAGLQIASCDSSPFSQAPGDRQEQSISADDNHTQPVHNPNPTTRTRSSHTDRTVVDAGITQRILDHVRRNGSTPCHNVTTVRTEVAGLPSEERPLRIRTDEPFRFRLVSVGEDGRPRCAGGDYYEADLEGEHWKGRPPIVDNQDGTYEVSILLDGQKAGLYNFTARLLFGNMHGLDHDPQDWRLPGDVAVAIAFHAEPAAGSRPVVSSSMGRCTPAQMQTAGAGGGRWTRGAYNASCKAGAADGRWLCLSGADAECEAPWCDGRVAALESNGWVYSDRQCSFHIFTQEEAWECLSGKWLFMWGDSNMLDFLRNLLVFGLGYPPPPWANISTWEMNRDVEQPLFVNPSRPDQAVRVSYVFNGHHETLGDYLGLDSLLDGKYRDKLRLFFNGTAGSPDTFVFNTGLHDGIHFPAVAGFAAAVERAADFWASVFRPLGKPLRLLMRTTVAPAGPARWKPSNPQKMESYNAILLEGFRRRFQGMHVLDAFDLTFPFHYDFCCSDGGHYGRPPGIHRWPWFQEPHHYFAEVMLVHMMLNSICHSEPSAADA